MAFPRLALALALAGAVGLAAFACGGGDGGRDASPATPAPAASVATVRVVTDEGYLAVMCEGLERFSIAVATETEAAGIAAVIVDFIAALAAIEPPTDVVEFHEAFIAYLEEAVDDPTRPLVVAPPLPDEDPRERLAAKERSVPECREPAFFAGAPADR